MLVQASDEDEAAELAEAYLVHQYRVDDAAKLMKGFSSVGPNKDLNWDAKPEPAKVTKVEVVKDTMLL
jgi:hypothetical protein